MKRRLLGAIVVVGLAVVVVPMLVKSPGNADQAMVRTITIPTDPASEQSPAAPPAPEPAQARVADASAGRSEMPQRAPMIPNPDAAVSDAGAASGGAMAPAPSADSENGGAQAASAPSAPPVQAPAPVEPASAPTAQAAPAPKPAPAPAPPPAQPEHKTQTAAAAVPSQPAGRGEWGVQVGSFSQPQNAEGVAKKLRNDGFDVFVSQAQVGDLTVHRVRVGAFASQDQASHAAHKLEASLGHGVQVLKVR